MSLAVGGHVCQVPTAARVFRVMDILYVVIIVLAAAAYGYAATLNFVGAESVKVVADRVRVSQRWMTPLGVLPTAGAVGLLVGHSSAFTRFPTSAMRSRLVQRGLWLNYATIGYHLLESIASLVAGSVALVGVGLNAAAGWWWADPVAALVMVPLIALEGLANR